MNRANLITDQPVFEHDCGECCKFLDTINTNATDTPHGFADIYIHKAENFPAEIIARFGDERNEYYQWADMSLMQSQLNIASRVRGELLARGILQVNHTWG